MWDFIVLGLLPGTDIQITWLSWLTMVLGTVGYFAGRRAIRQKLLLKAQLVLAFFVMSRRPLLA
jgi:hypothetical protein